MVSQFCSSVDFHEHTSKTITCDAKTCYIKTVWNSWNDSQCQTTSTSLLSSRSISSTPNICEIWNVTDAVLLGGSTVLIMSEYVGWRKQDMILEPTEHSTLSYHC